MKKKVANMHAHTNQTTSRILIPIILSLLGTYNGMLLSSDRDDQRNRGPAAAADATFNVPLRSRNTRFRHEELQDLIDVIRARTLAQGNAEQELHTASQRQRRADAYNNVLDQMVAQGHAERHIRDQARAYRNNLSWGAYLGDTADKAFQIGAQTFAQGGTRVMTEVAMVAAFERIPALWHSFTELLEALKDPKTYAQKKASQLNAFQNEIMFRTFVQQQKMESQMINKYVEHIDLQQKMNVNLENQLKLLRQLSEDATKTHDTHDSDKELFKQEIKQGQRAIADKVIAMANLPLPTVLLPSAQLPNVPAA